VAVYSVYEPPKVAPDLIERSDRLAFVKEGFSWPAFLVPLLWLIYYRMWVEFILLVAVYAALQWAFGSEPQGQALAAWASLGIGVLFASEANDLRTLSLQRRGYQLAGVASGRDRTEAERLFFRAWLPQQQATPANAAERPELSRATAAQPTAPREEGEEVIGFFPRP
jgi:Protein of unknown function (DUF2628)